MKRFGVAALFFAGGLHAATLLEQRIDDVIRRSPVLSRGMIGIEAVQINTGRILYSRDSNRLFVPASNTKLFSTALALLRLGPDYRFTTRVYSASRPDSDGCVRGDLVLYGGGDPSMSNLAVPYRVRAPAEDALAGIEELADRIAAAGVRTIEGDIVGDDTIWPYEPYPPGWAVEDALWIDGAPVSALMLNNNAIALRIQPGARIGDPAILSITPRIEYFAIDNRVRTALKSDPGGVRIERLPGSRLIRISGHVGVEHGGELDRLAVDDPALFAAFALYDALTRRGINIHGEPVARCRFESEAAVAPSGVVLAERTSPPLIELLRVIDKVSQNLWAEAMLRATAQRTRGDGSRRAGLEELRAFLTELGAAPDSNDFLDGSGLSRMTLVSPSLVVRLLRRMYASPYKEQWRELLPVGGKDGTLENRFDRQPAAHAIQAKTGSLEHVNALSGYVDSATWGEIAVSILVNNTAAHASEVQQVIDRIGLALVE
jgi:D-alanyl-D-alanine carboxypeptidase/D-alanyl-D-alanine-endopeptidase (penicillin-binding protein 4)